MDISAWIDRHAAFTPDKTAIRFAEKDTTYSHLAQRIGKIAGVLRHKLGIGHGDRVGYLGLNHPDFIALLFACARLGAIAMPLNWRLEEHEHRVLLEDCSPGVLIVDTSYAARGDRISAGLNIPVVCLDPCASGQRSLDGLILSSDAVSERQATGSYGDPVLLCYTSGATGKPKGVLLDQNALSLNAVNSIHMHGMSGDDVILNTLPLFHVGGLNILSLPVLHMGGTLVLHPAFDVPATYRALAQSKVTLTVLVPTQIVAMMNDGRWNTADFTALRMITTGSTTVPKNLVRKVHERGVPLVQVYGSTETGPIATYLTAGTALIAEGSAGKTAIHCEMRIVDEAGDDVATGTTGEILIRGGNVMRGYWNAPEATALALEDGWYHSGDLGHLDEDGFLYVDDRKKDMIISGGENIYPAELENVLAECPAIVETAVVGQPDDTWGEIVVAAVVVSDETTMTTSDVTGFLDGKLARYKHPRRVVFLKKLPRNVMGKVVKDELRTLLTGITEAGDESSVRLAQ
ncbi:MAG: long-chain fatty acid--CoA ligase [Hyphomicrobiales bacterium]|nr:long-chain fatty acid--CoA ligase [Hyphomicrobiales bacterium]MCP4998374.1 long-chain fatty acid--CoA ligase [Hyphomicrobiales bacterium]